MKYKIAKAPCFKNNFSLFGTRWNTEIQEGIYAMLEMLVDLVTTRLERDPVPCTLLTTLALVN